MEHMKSWATMQPIPDDNLTYALGIAVLACLCVVALIIVGVRA